MWHKEERRVTVKFKKLYRKIITRKRTIKHPILFYFIHQSSAAVKIFSVGVSCIELSIQLLHIGRQIQLSHKTKCKYLNLSKNYFL